MRALNGRSVMNGWKNVTRVNRRDIVSIEWRGVPYIPSIFYLRLGVETVWQCYWYLHNLPSYWEKKFLQNKHTSRPEFRHRITVYPGCCVTSSAAFVIIVYMSICYYIIFYGVCFIFLRKHFVRGYLLGGKNRQK